MLRVLVADDHQLVRQGLCRMVGDLDGVRVVAEANDGLEALDAVARQRVDVALLDIAMPHLDGLATLERLAVVAPDTRSVLVTVHGGEEYVLRCLEAGGHGFVLKGAGAHELELAVHAAGRGDCFLCPSVADRAVADYLRARAAEHAGPRLTSRQQEVLRLVAAGLGSKVIADRLGLSTSTVNAHRAAAMERLGVHNTRDLVREAARAGLLPPEA